MKRKKKTTSGFWGGVFFADNKRRPGHKTHQRAKVKRRR